MKEIFIPMQNDLGQGGLPISFTKPSQNLAIPSRPKIKSSAQDSCSILKSSPLKPQAICRHLSSQCTLFLPVKLQVPTWRWSVWPALPLAMWLLGPRSLKSHAGECSTWSARQRERLPPAVTGPQRGQSSTPSKCRSSAAAISNSVTSLFPWVYINFGFGTDQMLPQNN